MVSFMCRHTKNRTKMMIEALKCEAAGAATVNACLLAAREFSGIFGRKPIIYCVVLRIIIRAAETSCLCSFARCTDRFMASLRQYAQPDRPGNNAAQKQYAFPACRFLKPDDADQHRACRAETCPDGISGAERNVLHRQSQKIKSCAECERDPQ